MRRRKSLGLALGAGFSPEEVENKAALFRATHGLFLPA